MQRLIIGSSHVSFDRAGRGQTLALIHGFPLDHRMWAGQVAALSGGFDLILPDLPGFGDSSSITPPSIDALAERMFDLLQRLGVLPCIVGGFSMGGYVALSLARKHPEALRAMILLNTKAAADTPQAKQKRDDMIALAQTRGAAAIAEKMAPMQIHDPAAPRKATVLQTAKAIMGSIPTPTIVDALQAMRDRPDQTDFLAQIKIPTLVIAGASDQLIPLEDSRTMARQIPGAQFVEIPDAGHLSPVEQPHAVNSAILRFAHRLA